MFHYRDNDRRRSTGGPEVHVASRFGRPSLQYRSSKAHRNTVGGKASANDRCCVKDSTRTLRICIGFRGTWCPSSNPCNRLYEALATQTVKVNEVLAETICS